MAQAVAPCSEVTLKTKGSDFKALLDFGSMVTLIDESFFRVKPSQDQLHQWLVTRSMHTNYLI